LDPPEDGMSATALKREESPSHLNTPQSVWSFERATSRRH